MTKIYLILLLTGLFCQISGAEQSAEFHNPETILAKIHAGPDIGKQIYANFCSACHAQDPVIEIGAPRLGVKQDWQLRCQKGLQAMLTAIDPGFNNMPPRGGCFECTDTDLKLATLYMIPKDIKGCTAKPATPSPKRGGESR